jgi:hypothetical protein
MEQLINREGLPLTRRVRANPTSEVARIVSGLQWDTDRHPLDTHPAAEFRPVILRMDVPLTIQAVLAIQGWELGGLIVHLPEAEVSDLTVVVLEVEDSREGEAEDFQEEGAGALLVEGVGGIGEVILMMRIFGRWKK